MRLVLLLATNILPSVCFAQATIEGHVELPKSRSAPVVSKHYEVVTHGGVVSTNPPVAIVYLDGAPIKGAPPTKTIAQKDLAFVPPILAVQIGTRVEFPNQDDTYHNIFSYSPAKRFDLGRYRPDEKPVPSVLFDNPGLVTLRCDIHEHMRGLLLVVNTPYFATSDPGGRYRLSGLPPGHYTLKAWVDSSTTREHPVDVAKGGTLHVDFP